MHWSKSDLPRRWPIDRRGRFGGPYRCRPLIRGRGASAIAIHSRAVVQVPRSGASHKRRLHHGVEVLGVDPQQSGARSVRVEAPLGDPAPEGADADVRAFRRLREGLVALSGHRLLLRSDGSLLHFGKHRGGLGLDIDRRSLFWTLVGLDIVAAATDTTEPLVAPVKFPVGASPVFGLGPHHPSVGEASPGGRRPEQLR